MNVYPWHKEIFSRLRGGALPHAILLCGKEGSGKFDLAMRLSAALLCGRAEESCGSCPSCLWFSQGTHPDFRLIEPEALSDEAGKKQITVDEIRSLADFLNLSTHQGGSRVVLIHPAEEMNPHAANSLLKTLEEPPGGTFFILVSDKPQRLLPTILSRCRKVPMPTPSRAEALGWLASEGVPTPEIFLAEAGYSPLAALAAYNDRDENLARLLSEMQNPAALDPIGLAEAMQKTELRKIVAVVQKWGHDLASSKFSGSVRYYPVLAQKLATISSRLDGVELMRFNRDLLKTQAIAAHPLNQKLFIESLLWSYLELFRARASA